jgi:hypothetical protein
MHDPEQPRKPTRGLLAVALAAVALWPTASPAAASPADPATAHAAATCADYPDQAAAQRAADTRDSDGDGIYCESLPCPCSTTAGDDGGGQDPDGDQRPETMEGCVKPEGVQRLVFSATKYANMRAHFRAAVAEGWPRRLVLNRPGADARRDRLLQEIPTRYGFDRDEYPPAVGRGRGNGLTRGTNPRGWKADVRYVASSENRSHGAALGAKLRDLCDGTRFRYIFR